MTTWQPDVLGEGYEQHRIDLGDDPDGQGPIDATLVRRVPRDGEQVRGAVLYVHGFSDYFFQRELADFFAERGYAFYALDLRKCGRSLKAGHTAHYVSDLALYDAELDRALQVVRAEAGGADVLAVAHSTGGLVLSLWLDRVNRRPGGTAAAGIRGLILNSPWFDLQGAPYLRSIGTEVVKLVGRLKPTTPIKLPPGGAYGESLSITHQGEWEFDVAWKPIEGFPVTFGWMRAIRIGHAALHRGLDIGVPALVLRSTRTHFATAYGPEVDAADAVLDVRQIARWSGCLGDHTEIVPIDGARHDVFLSRSEPRAAAYATIDRWLDTNLPAQAPAPAAD
ncbi:alpha-beta hydrolase superfamily lysophospholipase [Mumia flava]|uniref:Alpha-beta hydrolase superfamily lysophospholipase n=1 Tax=Mumia flava TaxID=1348852 RepID=A0A0B2BJR4_9ACTN|nr:alpha/beta hydrolase [Mumia flava]PJJ57442.1 alpha-beta hydrolase superfamily lysophospholipase [Mumia flava]